MLAYIFTVGWARDAPAGPFTGPSGRQETGVARIAGVNIPTNKRVTISLRYIFGIGPTKAQDICTKLNIPAERRVNQLSDDEVPVSYTHLTLPTILRV